MNKIKGELGWEEFDSLNGVEIKNGEKLKVQFPNGALITLSAIVPQASQWAFTEDGPYKSQIRRALYRPTWNGVAADVPLRGLMAERIK